MSVTFIASTGLIFDRTLPKIGRKNTRIIFISRLRKRQDEREKKLFGSRPDDMVYEIYYHLYDRLVYSIWIDILYDKLSTTMEYAQTKISCQFLNNITNNGKCFTEHVYYKFREINDFNFIRYFKDIDFPIYSEGYYKILKFFKTPQNMIIEF